MKIRSLLLSSAALLAAACSSTPKEINHANFSAEPRKIAKAVTETSGTGVLDDSKIVLVPDFKVYFETKAGASAMAGDNRVSQRVQLGVDPTVMQEITDELYKQFVTDLKAMGYEVVEWKQLTEKNEEFAKYHAESMKPGPITINEYYVEYAPTGMKLDNPGFEIGKGSVGSIFATNLNDVMGRASSKLDAIRIAPSFIVGFADMNVEKGYNRASVEALQGMSVRAGSAWWLGGGVIRLERNLRSETEIGKFEDAQTAGDTVRGYASALSYALGGNKNDTYTKVLSADREKFKTQAIEQLKLAEAIFLERAKAEVD